MTKLLITSSLLNAYQYYIQDEWKSPEDSRADFLKTLSREKTPPTEAQQRGIDFENAIRLADVTRNHFDPDPIVRRFTEIVRDGIWQQSVKKDLKVGNQEFLLYGRTDVIKRDTIYDIKFTSNYELGKFLDLSQHPIYLYCSGLPNFSHLISDGKDWWREDYHNHAGIEDEIKSKVTEFLDYLENDKEAKEMFLTKWESK